MISTEDTARADEQLRMAIGQRRDDLATRALELAAQAMGGLGRHEVECRDRYLALEKKLDQIIAALLKATGALVFSLVTALSGVVWYVVVRH